MDNLELQEAVRRQEFLDEMRRRREAASTQAAPKDSYSATAIKNPTHAASQSGGGIIGFFIRSGIVKNKFQANIVLVVVAVGLIVWTLFNTFSSGSSKNVLTSEQQQQLIERQKHANIVPIP